MARWYEQRQVDKSAVGLGRSDEIVRDSMSSIHKLRSADWAIPWQAPLVAISGKLKSFSVQLPARYRWTLQPLALGVTIRLLVFAGGVAGRRLLRPNGFPGILRIWLQHDAAWYLNIARSGYYSHGSVPITANFFPLYPLTISIVEHITGLFIRQPDSYLVAGMVIAWLLFLVACVLLFRLVSDRFGEPTAYLAVLLLGIFPFSVFYGAAYTESLYLVLALVAFLGIDRGNWWLAGTGAMLAGATRPTGLIVGVAVVVAYVMDWLRTRHGLRWDLLSLALIPLGPVAFALYCQLHFGNLLAYETASSKGWGGGFQLNGVISYFRVLQHPDLWFVSERRFLGLIYVLVALAFLALCYPIYRLLGLSYLVFALLSCVSPILVFGVVQSTGRYMSVIFPAFIVLAYALQKRPTLRDMTIIAFALLLAVATVNYVLGYGVF
jgi:Mannosyltransferase (PIG-V)